MSKDLHHDLREIEIIAEMNERVYMDIPSHLRDQIKTIKSKTTKHNKK